MSDGRMQHGAERTTWQRAFWTGLGLTAATFLGSATLWAADRLAPLPTLIEQVESARTAYRPWTIDPRPAARQALVDALTALEKRAGDVSTERLESWSDYLQLPELRAMVQGDTPWDERRLDQLIERLSVDETGIDDPACLALRRAAQLDQTARRLAETDLAREFPRRIDALARDVKAWQQTADPQARIRIGHSIAWLEDAQQTPELVRDLRARWSQPNFVVHISRKFVSRYVEQEIKDQSVQVTNILGTLTRGPTTTNGALSLEFVPNDRRAELSIHLKGTTQAPRNVGHKGPATIHSASVTNFDVEKRLVFDDELGLSGERPAAQCRTDARIRSIQTQPKHFEKLLKPVFNKVAWKKADQLHELAEAEASRIAGQRISQQLEDQLTGPLGDLQQGFARYLRIGPTRIDEPPTFRTRSTIDALQLGIVQARRHQLAADVALAPLPESTGVGLAFHESFFPNISARYLFGGEEQNDERIETLAKILAGEVPSPLRVFSSSEPWSFRLDLNQPMTVSFRDGEIQLALNTSEWRVGDDAFSGGVEIRAVYRPQITRFGPQFHRQGSLQLVASDDRPWSALEQERLLPLLEEKFGALLPPVGRFNNLIIPSGGSFGPIAQLRLKTLDCDAGWFRLGYE